MRPPGARIQTRTQRHPQHPTQKLIYNHTTETSPAIQHDNN